MNKNQIQIKKILLASAFNKHSHNTSFICDLIEQLVIWDNITTSTNHITDAAEYILAYLELGFGYLEHKELFDYVLQTVGLNNDVIENLQKKNPTITLNRDQLRALIGRWPASPYNSHTINSAITDIITHVKNNEFGTYTYYTAKKDGSYTALYYLYIHKDYVIFNDVFKNKFYRVVNKENTNDSLQP